MPELAAGVSPDDEKETMTAMGFLEHLEELRRRIIYSIIAVVIGFFACWAYVEKIYDVVQAPIMTALKNNGLAQKLVYLNPTDGLISISRRPSSPACSSPHRSCCTRS